MQKITVLFILVIGLAAIIFPVQASDQIQYTSQPDEVAIFRNNIAFARDTLQLPGGVAVAIVLPNTIYQDTLILREDGERVPLYRMNRSGESLLLQWQSSGSSDLREVTLEYLLTGLSWTPKYDLWIRNSVDEDPNDDIEMVDLHFFAEIVNSVLPFDDVTVRLVDGQVDTSQALTTVSTVTTNQYIAGYENFAAEATPTLAGAASIQHIYDIANLNANIGDTIYLSLQEATLSARRIHFWNASAENQVAVIYKVRNDTELPFAEGIVRAYEGGLFIGSDFVELTPIGGEGSITVGYLQEMRVSRSETVTSLSVYTEWDTRHDVTLTLTNYSQEEVAVTVVDYYPEQSTDIVLSLPAQEQSGNILRWEVTVPAGETLTITYQFKATY